MHLVAGLPTLHHDRLRGDADKLLGDLSIVYPIRPAFSLLVLKQFHHTNFHVVTPQKGLKLQ